MIKAVIFDLDHTLFDRYKTIEKIVDTLDTSKLFKNTANKETVKKEWIYADKNYIHLGFDPIFDYLSGKDLLADGMTKENFFQEGIASLFAGVAVPFDFTENVLKELGKTYKIGLITNGKHALQAKKLEMLGIGGLFDEVIISDDYGVRKPDVKLYHIMAEKLGLDPSEMVYVGDHPKNDVDASRNAGYTPVWVRTTGTWVYPEIEKPSLQVDTVEELAEMLKNL